MTAAEVLLLSDCRTMPVDLAQIAQRFNIKMISYNGCAKTYDMNIKDIYHDISHMGFSFRDEHHFICAINENACGKQRRRWTTAHELAHIFLGHVDEAATLKPCECEAQADHFAADLLAPMCVLHFCGVESPEEIARLTGLSAQASNIRWHELCKLRRAHSERMRLAARSGTDLQSTEVLLPDLATKRLLEQYLPFIAEYITRRAERSNPISQK